MKSIPFVSLRLIALLAVIFAMNPSLHCQERAGLTALNEYVEFKLKRDHIPGLAVCIVDKDRIAWQKGYGFQNLEQRVPMTTQSVLGTASLAKLVTAIAVMQLAERNQLGLHEPINKYLPFRIQHPDFPDDHITISQLLSHTGSINNGPSLWRSYSCDPQTMSRAEWVMAYFLPDGVLYHKDGNFCRHRPGDGFLYSNAGYGLLSYMVEVVSGEPFDQFCKENIFDPLQMYNTSFEVAGIRRERLCTMYSYGYSMDLERDLQQPGIDFGTIVSGEYLFPLCNYTTPTIGAAGLYSSVEELAKLLLALMNDGVFGHNELLSKESVATIFSPYVNPRLLPEKFEGYGRGGHALKVGDHERVWGHTGADPGISTFMLFNPVTKLGAVVLTNRYVDIRDLIEWVFGEGRQWRRNVGIRQDHEVVFRVLPNYLPGGSRIFIIGNHRHLGCWVSAGIPLSPQKDRSWQKTFRFADSSRIEFKITRGSWDTEAAGPDGKDCPQYTLLVEKDTVLNVIVADWKDQTGK
jgi:CubicO group peptidase (beta-lactamase class C family)